MASDTSLLEESTFHNWLRSALAVLIAKEGVEEMVHDEMVDLQRDLLQYICTNFKVPDGTECSECTTENVLHCKTHEFCTDGRAPCKLHDQTVLAKMPGKACAKQLCQHLKDGIRRNHRKKAPSWKITDARYWCTDSFQLAKCFMPPDGYKYVSSYKESHFNGVLSVIINCKRFKKKFVDDLSSMTNVCSEARSVASTIRHSHGLTITETNLQAYICTLVTFLSDARYLATNGNAIAAVSKLNKLKKDKFVISSTSLPNVIEIIIMEHMTTSLTEIEKAKLTALKEIKEESLARNMTLEEVCGSFQEKMYTFQIKCEKAAFVLSGNITVNVSNDSDRLCQQDFKIIRKNLQEDLVAFYEEEHKAIPVSPLVPSHDANVLDFYVKPNMEISQWSIVGNSSRGVPKTRVATCSDIFKNGSSLCHDIYITAKAGNGKTMFSKRLCLIWCYTKGGTKISYSNIEKHETEMLGLFSFLFFIPLREVRGNLCELVDMIHTQIISKLPQSDHYSMVFLKKILQIENCLVILEGLDEWFHPETGSCVNPSPIPHRRTRGDCTILSTTRVSKMHQAKIANTAVDKYIEMRELGNESTKQLIHNVVLSITGTDLKEELAINFIEAIKRKGISEIASTPILLIQLLCLWRDGKTKGRTHCDIYLNIIELLLQLGEERHGKPSFLAVRKGSRNQTELPQSLQKHENCRNYYELLISVGNVAFTGSFSSRHEASSLVYESPLVRNIMSEEEIWWCLQMGLLTEKTANMVSSKPVSNYSFNHKTYAEFFAALYIQACSESDIVLKSCQNLETILSMRNVLIFLSGLNSEVFSVLSQKLNKVISDVCFTRNFRRTDTLMNSDLSENHKLLKLYQDINISCARECGKDGNTIYLDDFFLDENIEKEEHCRMLMTLTEMNKERIKCLTIADMNVDMFRRSIDIFQVNQMNTLEKVFIRSEFDEDDLDVLLTSSVKTLKCIRVISSIWKESRSTRRHIPLSEPCCSAIQNMPNLVSLVMEYLILSHIQLKTLVVWVERKVKMSQFGLSGIRCKDHGETCPGVALDLSRHSQVESLVLELSPISDIRINTTSLQECSIGECYSKHVFFDMLKSLENANNLRAVQYFHLTPPEVIEQSLNTLRKLARLVFLELHEIDLGDRDFELPESMTNIRCIHLNDMKMSAAVLKNLLNRVKMFHRPIRIDILNCQITPNGLFQKLRDDIHSSNDFSVLNEWSTNVDSLFSFETKTTEEYD